MKSKPTVRKCGCGCDWIVSYRGASYIEDSWEEAMLRAFELFRDPGGIQARYAQLHV